jgi:hypothetical protein
VLFTAPTACNGGSPTSAGRAARRRVSFEAPSEDRAGAIMRVPVFDAVAADTPDAAYAEIRGKGRLL